MSLGSNAPRKPNVASASTTLYKASSRFLHSGERIQGPGKGVKRQRAAAVAAAAAVSLDSTESNDNLTEVSRCFAVTELKGGKSKKRFVGVRQRPSGRWVAEIKDTTQKIRLWLGTFDSAEEGAKAYDSAARALRGANTRTNFVPAMACEGTVPASKAARLIRLRQMAAATKACEKEAARNVESKRAADFKVEPSPLPLVKQEFQQQSINNVDHPLDDHTSSKPARLMGRRHNAPAKSEQVEDVDVPPPTDHCSVVDTGHLVKLDPPPKLEPQQSITSENLSNAIPHSLGSPQESSTSRRILSPRASFECMADEGVIQSVTNNYVDATDQFNEERFAAHRLSFGDHVYDFEAPPPIPLHVATLDARSLPGGYSHQISSPCATNRDMYGAAATLESLEHGEVTCPRRVYHHPDEGDDDDAMDLDDEKHKKCVDTESTKCEAQDSSSMEYPSFDLYDRAKAQEGCILSELVVPEIPWPEYMLMDEMEMGSLGLDLSCETSGVYTTPFDFSTEAIDHDSCTSGVLPSKFFPMHYEQSSTSPPAGSQDFQECVLLTEIPELEDSPEPGPPPLSPPETAPEQLWRLNDSTTAWDDQSSGSSKPLQSDSGENQDQEELWSSMDLAPLCMVA